MQYNIKLSKNFTSQFNKMVEKYGEDFLRLQGLDDEKLSDTDFINGFIDAENVAENSIDANSNVAQKDVVTMMSEMSKPRQKLLAFHKIYYECQKKYGFKFANEAMESLWNYDIYLHDFNTSTFFDYCYAADLKPLVDKGLYFVENYHAEPPKHLDSFIQLIIEWVAFLLKRQSGAVGMPNLLPYLFYFWNKDVKEGYYTKSPEQYRDQ